MVERFERRGFAIIPGQPDPDIAIALREVREQALERVTEVDLLVAALREHISDLRLERDRLLEENRRLAAELDATKTREAAAGARWLVSRQKTQR